MLCGHGDVGFQHIRGRSAFTYSMNISSIFFLVRCLPRYNEYTQRKHTSKPPSRVLRKSGHTIFVFHGQNLLLTHSTINTRRVNTNFRTCFASQRIRRSFGLEKSIPNQCPGPSLNLSLILAAISPHTTKYQLHDSRVEWRRIAVIAQLNTHRERAILRDFIILTQSTEVAIMCVQCDRGGRAIGQSGVCLTRVALTRLRR
jgi:hypothetical protein